MPVDHRAGRHPQSKALSAVERLEIYGYAYYARLLECLKEEFPAVLHAVGEEAFDSFALGYLQKYPSRSYTLFELGAKFPQYLHETRPATRRRPAASRAAEATPAMLDPVRHRSGDLRADGGRSVRRAGARRWGLLDGRSVRPLDGEQFLAARLVPVECLRLLALRFSGRRFLQGGHGEKRSVPPPGPAETFLAVTRMNYVVCHHRLSDAAYELLAAILDRQVLSEAIERAAGSSADAPDQLAVNLQSWLQGDPHLRDIPVVVTSSLDELDSVVRCLEMGAEDYFTKPVNHVLLNARINASLEKSGCAISSVS